MRLPLFLLSIIATQYLHAQIITGKVTDDKQHPVKSASVLLLKQSDSSLAKSSLSDNNGNFKFTEVADGKYFVEVSVVSHKKNFSKVEVTGKEVKWK